MTWYKTFNYSKNPLSIKPNPEYGLFFENKNILQETIEGITLERNITIKGPLGTGKTSILKRIIKQYGGKRKIYYYNAFSNKTGINYKRVLQKAGNFFSRLFSIQSKNVILFIDEAQHLEEENLLELKNYIGSHFKSVIIATSDNKFKLPKEIQEEFTVQLDTSNFTQDDAVQIIIERLGTNYEEILSNKELQNLFDKSKTPRDFLLRTEKHCQEKYQSEEE